MNDAFELSLDSLKEQYAAFLKKIGKRKDFLRNPVVAFITLKEGLNSSVDTMDCNMLEELLTKK